MGWDELLQAVQLLTPEEQRQLRARLDERLGQKPEAAKVQAFHQALMASGLVTTIKTPHTQAVGPRRLIEVKGKLLSETIMEERR